jgi:hypothetical protein
MPRKQTAQEYLDSLYEVNSTWREMLGDVVVRAAIQGCFDLDEELVVESLNEGNEDRDDVPVVTMDDLWKFSEYAVTELTKRWEEQEVSGEINEEEFYWIERAIEETDTEAYLEILSENYPKLHAAFVRCLESEG